MNRLRLLIRKLYKIYRSIFTRYYAFRAGLTYDRTWTISKRMYVVRPNKFHDQGEIKIGHYFQAQGNLKQNLFGIIQPVILQVGVAAKLHIGDNVGISGSTISATQEITIGNNVLIGSGCVICDSDAHPLNPLERDRPERTHRSPIIIEDNVFIGARTIVLKGVTIGANSVIGAGSIVSKSIPCNVIAAGNPCIVIRSLNKNEN